MADSAKAAEAAGSCKAAVVKCDPPMHLVCFLLNIFAPGWGSMISACLCKDGFHTNAFVFGLLQCLLSWTIVCWIWSIMHGYWIYKESA